MSSNRFDLDPYAGDGDGGYTERRSVVTEGCDCLGELHAVDGDDHPDLVYLYTALDETDSQSAASTGL